MEATLKKTNVFFAILLSLLVANSVIGISLFISFKISWELSIVSSILWALLIIFFGFVYKRWFLIWASLIAIIASLLCGMYINDYADLKNGEIIENISIKDVNKYPDAKGYIFTDGFINKDMTTTYQKIRKDSHNRTSISFYYAAPVIRKNWDITKPVTLFAVGEFKAEINNWDKPFKAGIKPSKIYSDEFNTAVEKCIYSNKLKFEKDFVIIKWVESPQRAIQKVFDDFKETLLIWNIIMILGILIFRIIYYFKQKKEKEIKPDDNLKNKIDSLSVNTIIRILFSFYLFYILIFSLFYSKFNFSNLYTISISLISIVFYIIAISSLNIAHNKDKRSITDLIYIVIYPFFVYTLIFYKLGLNIDSIILFSGFFYFFIITGGFIFGILLSPLLTKWGEKNKNNNVINITKEKVRVKAKKFKYALFTFLSSLFIALTVVFIKLISTVKQLGIYRIAVFYFFLFIGIGLIIKFTYSHTIYNIVNDPDLKKKHANK